MRGLHQHFEMRQVITVRAKESAQHQPASLAHYQDAQLYETTFKSRKKDVAFFVELLTNIILEKEVHNQRKFQKRCSYIIYL